MAWTARPAHRAIEGGDNLAKAVAPSAGTGIPHIEAAVPASLAAARTAVLSRATAASLPQNNLG